MLCPARTWSGAPPGTLSYPSWIPGPPGGEEIHRAGRKVLRYVLSVCAIIAINFALPRLMPGDPVMNLIGEDAMVTPAQLAEIRAKIGLDRPVTVQFVSCLGDLLCGDLGYSFHLHGPVAGILWSRMSWTLLFAGTAIVLGALIGIIAGALSGWKPETRRSRAVTCAAMAVSCTPPYFLAMLFLAFFAFRLGLFPAKGYYDVLTAGSVVHHLLLPVAVLTLFAASRNLLVMRGSVVQEKNSHYALYARAKGLFGRQILFRHLLRNASLPVITLVALDFGFIFSGALFIEIVFSLNGMGTLIYDAILARDYPLLQGAFLVIALLVVTANIIADLLYGALDPRVREGGV